MSDSNHSDEDEPRGGELLVVPAGGGVLCKRLGPGPDAEKAHTGEVPAGGWHQNLFHLQKYLFQLLHG